jgi:hypothetical protein
MIEITYPDRVKLEYRNDRQEGAFHSMTVYGEIQDGLRHGQFEHGCTVFEWFQEDRYHRLEGPAMIEAHFMAPSFRWFLWGERLW